MEYEKRMERNRGQGLRITEIPPEGEFETIECPFCKNPLLIGVCTNGKLNGASVYCKRCKRRLRIDENN